MPKNRALFALSCADPTNKSAGQSLLVVEPSEQEAVVSVPSHSGAGWMIPRRQPWQALFDADGFPDPSYLDALGEAEAAEVMDSLTHLAESVMLGFDVPPMYAQSLERLLCL